MPVDDLQFIYQGLYLFDGFPVAVGDLFEVRDWNIIGGHVEVRALVAGLRFMVQTSNEGLLMVKVVGTSVLANEGRLDEDAKRPIGGSAAHRTDKRLKACATSDFSSCKLSGNGRWIRCVFRARCGF